MASVSKNRRYRGSLSEEYKSFPIQNDDDFLALSLCGAALSLRAGFSGESRDWHWSRLAMDRTDTKEDLGYLNGWCLDRRIGLIS